MTHPEKAFTLRLFRIYLKDLPKDCRNFSFEEQIYRDGENRRSTSWPCSVFFLLLPNSMKKQNQQWCTCLYILSMMHSIHQSQRRALLPLTVSQKLSSESHCSSTTMNMHCSSFSVIRTSACCCQYLLEQGNMCYSSAERAPANPEPL